MNSNDIKQLLGFYAFCVFLALSMFGSFYVFNFVKEITREQDIVMWDGKEYTFPKDNMGYGYDLAINTAYAGASVKVKNDVFGRGSNMIWAELVSLDVSGMGAHIREGKDGQGNIVIGLFVDKEFSEDKTFYESGGARYPKVRLTNKGGKGILLDLISIKYLGQNYAYYDFDVRVWRELVVRHYKGIIDLARAVQ